MKLQNVHKFIEDLKKKCKTYGVKLVLHDAKHIIDEDRKFGGWFDAQNKELHCAFPSKIQKKYVELLIHESCHMDQWIQNTKYWAIEREHNSLDEVWKLLSNQKIKRLAFHLKNVQLMEAECEEMSIRKILEYDININTESYARKANSYLLFYCLIPLTNTWTDYPPYKFPQIWRQMSNKILKTFKISPELESLYVEKCYKKRRKIKTPNR